MDQDTEAPKIEFEEEESSRVSYFETPKLIQWVMRSSGGLVTDEKKAEYVLIGFVAIVVIISLFLTFGGGPGGQKPSPSMLEQINKMPVNR